MESSDAAPTVPILVIIPCVDEKQHIEGIITCVLREAARLTMKIIVVDGGSTDGTLTILHRLTERDSRIIMLDNKKRIQSVAVNSAVDAYGADAEFLIRLDAHVDYPDRYCERLVAIQARTGADAVAVTMHATGRTCFQRAVAAAQNSFLGNGGSPHRNAEGDRWVEHGHHALMSMEAFKAVGGYDETFSHNEDADLDLRLNRGGYRIFLSGEAPITYHPRSSAPALFSQYFNFGCGRARNIIKNRCRPVLRQMLPPAVAPALGLLLLIPISPKYAFPALCWSLLCLGYGLVLAVRLRDLCAAASGFAAMIMHAAWSFGFFKGLIQGVGRASKMTRRGEELLPSKRTRNIAPV
jgi:succinoglycan biosynthesis protein ExoA